MRVVASIEARRRDRVHPQEDIFSQVIWRDGENQMRSIAPTPNCDVDEPSHRRLKKEARRQQSLFMTLSSMLLGKKSGRYGEIEMAT